ncbi:MAG: hypothetical protein DA328_08930 [Nitrososphaeraceae archaeon]|nr:hypothetical protein [Nitrososphaeraceae archaeon]
MVNGQSIQILQRKKESISIANIGHYSGIIVAINELDIRAVEDSAVGYAVAQALLDQIATHESGLIIRQLIPALDLLDASSAAITSHGWRQPVSGNYTGTNGATKETIYTTGVTSKNDRKTIVIYGYTVISGPARESAVLKSLEWIYNKGSVKIIDFHQIQLLESAKLQTGVFRTPILAKKNDDLKIEVIANTDAATSAKFDQIILLGSVVEAVGANMMG